MATITNPLPPEPRRSSPPRSIPPYSPLSSTTGASLGGRQQRQRVAQRRAGGLLFLATLFILINLAADVLYAWLDPRIKYSK